MTEPVLLGIDLGTSAVKVVAVRAGAAPSLVAEATSEYPLSTPHPGWSEQDPADWWRGVASATRRVMSALAPNDRPRGVALSGQMHGATLLDAHGAVLRPCILWNDQRSAPQCDAMTASLGLPRLLSWVANPALAGFTAPKLLWVRQNEPEVYRRLATLLLPKDYINYRLAGVFATEVSDASGTLLFDVAHRRWSGDMLSALDIPASILPPAHESADVIGAVTSEAARETGIPEGTPVIAGGADNACAAIGVGVVAPGETMVSVGTSGTVVAPTREPHVDPGARLHTFCHAVPDTWYLMGVVLSAGGSLRWYRDTVGEAEDAVARAQGRDPYEVLMDEAASVGAGSEGLVFLPYLSGERSPWGDPNARGAFVGLSLRHSRAHLVRSVLEGVCCALADSTDVMRELDVPVDAARVVGGGARSALWMHVLANVLQVDAGRGGETAGPSLGAALLAGVGSGVYGSVGEATSSLTSEGLWQPGTDADIYERLRRIYRNLYPSLHNSFDDLADFVDQLVPVNRTLTGA